MLQEIIVDIITGLVKVIKTSREALAQDLREIANKIEAGALIPNEAFDRARQTLDDTQSARDNLPD